MEQLICHLFGDYVFQNNWMARAKLSSNAVALLHGFIYSLIFFLALMPDWRSLLIIWLTHSLIDRFAMAKKWCQVANWRFDTVDGFAAATPDYLRVWVVILVDNTFHLAINYVALGWQW